MPETLDELLRDGRVLPFIGAGFSRVAGFPDWFGLLREVSNGIVGGSDFDNVVRSCGHDPLRVAEYLLVRSGGNIGPIRHRISSILRTPNPFVSSAHIDLTNLRLPLVYTTNFDELIESTYQMLGIPIDICCNARDLALARTGRTQIVKFHGDLQYDDTLVLTESSFNSRLDLESPLDLKFRGDVLGRSLLFIGYGFGDINIRVIWFKLARLMQSVPSDDRPPSFIVRVNLNPVLEALDRAAGLTTIVLDPEARATSAEERQRLLEQFMVRLTFAAEKTSKTDERPGLAPYCSPALLDRAADLICSAPRSLDAAAGQVLDAIVSRQLHDCARPAAERLLRTFSDRRPRGPLIEYRKAFALNYAMTYGDRHMHGGSADGTV